MEVAEILKEKLINLNLEASNKKDVIFKLSDMMSEAGLLYDRDGFIEDVYLRESEGITGMGNNIAIPHGKSKDVRYPGVAIGRTKNMIQWESYDDQPANLFFLFAVPDDKEGSVIHLKLLSQLATKLADENLLDKIKQASSVSDFIKLLKE